MNGHFHLYPVGKRIWIVSLLELYVLLLIYDSKVKLKTIIELFTRQYSRRM